MKKQKVLFICVHNSARSQMAEAWLNYTCGKFFEAQSAGLEAGTMNPLVVQAMMEEGIDLSNKQTQKVFDVWASGQIFRYVITVCNGKSFDFTQAELDIAKSILLRVMAGASQVGELEEMMRNVGFERIKIAPKDTSRSFIREWLPGKRVGDYLVSATIEAVRPG